MSSALYIKSITEFLARQGRVAAAGKPLIRLSTVEGPAIKRRLMGIPLDQDEIRLRTDTAGIARRHAATKARHQLI